jgi:NTE family protein
LFSAIRDSRGDVKVDGGVLDNYPVRLFDQNKYIDLQSNPDHGVVPKFYQKINDALAPGALQYIYNRETLGFRLSSPKDQPVDQAPNRHQQLQIRSLFVYLRRLAAAFLNVQNNSHLETEDWHRTIYVNTRHINGFNFNIDRPTKECLVEAGRQGVKDYFNWYDNSKVGSPGKAGAYPINKPDYESKMKKSRIKKS